MFKTYLPAKYSITFSPQRIQILKTTTQKLDILASPDADNIFMNGSVEKKNNNTYNCIDKPASIPSALIKLNILKIYYVYVEYKSHLPSEC